MGLIERIIVVVLAIAAFCAALDVSNAFAAFITLCTAAAIVFYIRFQQRLAPRTRTLGSSTQYNLFRLVGPPIQGWLLNVMAFMIENSNVMRSLGRRTSHFNELRSLDITHQPPHQHQHQHQQQQQQQQQQHQQQQHHLYPTFIPRHFQPPSIQHPLIDVAQKLIDRQTSLNSKQSLTNSGGSFRFRTVNDYYHAYSSKRISPLELAQRLIDALEDAQESHKLNAIVEWDRESILKQANESTKRFAKNKPRSVLEGVPISVKDQIDVMPFHTSKGRRTASVATSDATVIQRLRQAGAIIYGKAHQTEMGIHVTGLNSNQRYGHCRNPYNPLHHTGGSSSGSGSAVGAGLGPISIGADGGGSIRLPGGLCGAVGLKPTHGRVSLMGDTACYGSTVDVVGPIAATPFDAAIAMAIIAGTDIDDYATYHAPPVSLQRLLSDDLERLDGLRIGYYEPWFSDAEQHVVSACMSTLEELQSAGASLHKISIGDLDSMVVAHVLTITSEMYNDVHLDASLNSSSFTSSTRVLFGLVSGSTANDYLQAARVRTYMIEKFLELLKEVDIIVTPNTPCTAPIIPPNLAENEDESDIQKQSQLMRFMNAPNLTGLPAIAFPVGVSSLNLPIALQAIAAPWCEDLLLRVATVAMQSTQRTPPRVFYDLLHDT